MAASKSVLERLEAVEKALAEAAKYNHPGKWDQHGGWECAAESQILEAFAGKLSTGTCAILQGAGRHFGIAVYSNIGTRSLQQGIARCTRRAEGSKRIRTLS